MKEEMKMPGFTADASLKKRIHHYSINQKVHSGRDVIIPQMMGPLPIVTLPSPSNKHDCYVDCIHAGHHKMFCWNYCYGK